MAATSPYTGNDYTAGSNFRPYELPVNDIFRAISAQNQFWDAGAARVKSYYDKSLDLDLSLDENRKIRDQYMKDAKKEMIKISSMDLSDPSVQRKGMNIFKPLFKDNSIIQDDYLTRLQKNIYQDAERYKNDEKSKGEGFHMDNLAYALRPFKGFGKDTKREDMESIFNRAKNSSYIPYYDQSKERLDILKNCTPDNISNTTSQGMYLETEKDKSLTQEKLWGCLNSQLSDKARMQTRISAAVRYNDDYKALSDDWVSYYTSKKSAYQNKIAELTAKSAALKGSNKDEDKLLLANYKDQIDQYTDQITGIDGLDSRISKLGNVDYVANNYEDLAYESYFNRYNGAFASAFARMDIERDKKADPVAMMYYVQDKYDKRQNQKILADFQLKEMDLQNKILAGEGNMSFDEKLKLFKSRGWDTGILNSVYGDAQKQEGPSLDMMNSRIDNYNTEIAKKASDIIDFIKGNKDLEKIATGVTDEQSLNNKISIITTYLSDALSRDKNNTTALELKDAMNSYIQLLNDRTHDKFIVESAWKEVEKNNSTLFDNSSYKDIKPLVFGNHVIKADDIFDAIAGKSDKYIFQKDYTYYTPPVKKGEPIAIGMDRIIDKKTGEVLIDQLDGKNWEWYVPIIKKIDKQSSSQKELVNDILTKKLATQKRVFLSGNLAGEGTMDAKNPNETLRSLQSIFGILGKDTKFSTTGAYDPTTGEIEVQAQNAKGLISYKTLDNAVAKSGYGASISLGKGNAEESIKLKLPNLQLIHEPSGIETITNLIDMAGNTVLEDKTIGINGQSIPAGISPSGKPVSVIVSRNIATNSPKYTIQIEDIKIPTSSREEAINKLQKILSGSLN